MNGTYYKNPTFPAAIDNNYHETVIKTEDRKYLIETYIDILKNNIGKKVNINMNNNNETKTYSGILEKTTDDTIIISNPETGNWFLLLSKYLNYIEFEERINI